MTDLAPPTTVLTQSETMARHGITEVSVPYFHYGEFRYTNLKDALAQAERDHSHGVVRKAR